MDIAKPKVSLIIYKEVAKLYNKAASLVLLTSKKPWIEQLSKVFNSLSSVHLFCVC